MYVKIIIDNVEHKLDVFEVDGKRVTVDLPLSDGNHNITSYKVFDDDDILLSEDNTTKVVKVDSSFTKELTITDNHTKMAMASTQLVNMNYGYLYVKDDTKLGNEVTIPISGVLGLLEERFADYAADDIYKVKPITSKVKAVFSIQTYLNGKETGFSMYDYKNKKPLYLTYNKTGNPSDVYKFVIQMRMYVEGANKIVETNRGIDGDWTITVKGDEDLITDNDGIVTFTMFPTSNWVSNATYKFTYAD